MSKEGDNKAVVGRWFTEFWGEKCNLSVVDEIAAPSFKEPIAQMLVDEQTTLTDLQAKLNEARDSQRGNWSVHQDRSDSAARRGDQLDKQIADIRYGFVKSLTELQSAIMHHDEACVRMSSAKS